MILLSRCFVSSEDYTTEPLELERRFLVLVELLKLCPKNLPQTSELNQSTFNSIEQHQLVVVDHWFTRFKFMAAKLQITDSLVSTMDIICRF